VNAAGKGRNVLVVCKCYDSAVGWIDLVQLMKIIAVIGENSESESRGPTQESGDTRFYRVMSLVTAAEQGGAEGGSLAGERIAGAELVAGGKCAVGGAARRRRSGFDPCRLVRQVKQFAG
jgi:hypothetical protein